MGLRGEWWIDDSGQATFADGDVGDLNHEVMAFRAALGLEDDFADPDDPLLGVVPGKKLTAKEIDALRASGAEEDAIQFFKDGHGDAREYMMLNHGWIRVADEDFQLYEFDDAALRNIRDFLNSEYPEDEDPLVDTFEIDEVKKGGQYLSLTGADLLESGKSAAALKYSARRERPEWHNPHKLGTVWAAKAKIKIQDDSVFPPRWKTLAECMDTPNAIAACIERHNLRGDLWVFGAASGRQYLGRR